MVWDFIGVYYKTVGKYFMSEQGRSYLYANTQLRT